jgi:small multidrug resistance pump
MNHSSSTHKSCEQKNAPTSAWVMLTLAICFEIAGAIGLRFSEGFSLLLPTTLALTAFTLALYLVSHVMKSLPVSIAYPMWAGGGTAGVAVLGFILLDEGMSPLKLIGILLIIIGVVMINRVSEKTSGC